MAIVKQSIEQKGIEADRKAKSTRKLARKLNQIVDEMEAKRSEYNELINSNHYRPNRASKDNRTGLLTKPALRIRATFTARIIYNTYVVTS